MDNLLDWFEDNKIIWVTILAVLAAMEVMVTVIAAYILQKVKKIQKMRWDIDGMFDLSTCDCECRWSVINNILYHANIFRQPPCLDLTDQSFSLQYTAGSYQHLVSTHAQYQMKTLGNISPGQNIEQSIAKKYFLFFILFC